MEIFTYGNGVMLGSLLQAVAALTATDDYLRLIRIMFILSTLIVAIEIVWTGRFKPTARLFAIIFMLNAAILSTEDVQIVDRVNSANDSEVANVPVGLVAPLVVFTTIGDWATVAFETVFALPNDLRYQTNGLLFASRLVEATTQFEITDTRMANNLSEFAQGCIYYGIMADWFAIETVMESGNIWAALPAGSFGNAIFVNYENAEGSKTLIGCRDVRNLLQADWAAAVDEMTSVYGQRMFPEYAEADAKARLLSSIPQSYQFMAGIAGTAADIVRQNAMINAMRRSFTNLANSSGAPAAAQDYALAQAEAQQRTTYATLGAMASRSLTLIKNLLETLIYGIFPIAFIMALIAIIQGKAILMYFKLLFWLQLWAPLYAILNFAMATHAAEATTATASMAGGGVPLLNMMTYTGMNAVNSDMSAMAGYLSWVIPAFSWMIVSGSGYAAAQLASSLGSVAQSSGSAAAGSASSGNISLGNYGAYNGRMFQTNNSPSLSRGLGTRVNPSTGATMTTSAGGFQTMSTPQNSTPFTANLASNIKSSVSTGVSSSVQAARNAATSFANQTQSTFSNMQKLSQGTSAASSTSSGSSTGSSSEFGQSFGKVNSLAEQFGQKHGMSKAQAASMLLAASMDSNKMLVGMGFAAATGMAGLGKLGFEGKSLSSEAWDAAKRFASDNNFGERWTSATKAGQQEAQQQSQQRNDAQSKDIAAGFNRQNSASSSLQSSLTQAQAWQQLSSQMKESGGSGSVAAVGALMQYGRSQGYDMEQLAAQSASITGNSTGATQTLQRVVNDFVSNQAASMAGVDAPPTAGTVQQANQSNNASVVAASESPGAAPGSNNVLAGSVDNVQMVRAMAEQAGVPSAAMIGKSSEEIAQMVNDRVSSQSSQISQGESTVESGGAVLQTEAEEKSAPGNQNHMVNATGQTVSAGVDAVVDGVGELKRVGSNLIGEFISSDSKQPGEEAPSPGPSAGAVLSGGKTAWANRLD